MSTGSRKSYSQLPNCTSKEKELKMLENDLEDIMAQALFNAGDTTKPMDERLDVIEIFAGYMVTSALATALQSITCITRHRSDGYTYYTVPHETCLVFYDRSYCTCQRHACHHVQLVDVWLASAMPVVDVRDDTDDYAVTLFNAV